MLNQVSRKYVKECFKQQKVQLSKETIDNIMYHLRVQVSKMALRSKECNIKRLTPDLLHLALGKYGGMK